MRSGKFREVSAILFDFGGTLDSDGDHWLDRFYALYKKTGLKLPLLEIKRAFYRADGLCHGHPAVLDAGLRPMMKQHVRLQFEALGLKANGIEGIMVDAFCSQSEQYLRRNALLLKQLRESFRLGVVSNFCGNVAVLCREAGLESFLDVIIDSHRLGVGKPDHRIFRAALDRLALPPSRVVFVGDSYDRDILPARGLGMKTVWMPGPNPRGPADAGCADERISELPDLPEVLS